MKFRKRPIIIEAIKLIYENVSAIRIFIGAGLLADNKPELNLEKEMVLYIPTLEGLMTAKEGDWIIKGVQGEFYPCKPDIFQATYEKVD